ncbi:hypothetical protein CL616_02410 [archaeon]|nr:hypothetical protein [archaeon]|tara:strand:- start:72 stop:413 length:342 start_codon:yes stop_codon:yes gene_type:complete
MAQREIAPQREYETLKDFVDGQNNFYVYFREDQWAQRVYRCRPHFLRFQEANPEIEEELTALTAPAIGSRFVNWDILPYEKLWEAYKIMSKLVYVDDPYVMREGQPDAWFLCR